MAIHPILMSAPMVRAILREIDAPGTGKTQTRRTMNPQPAEGYTFVGIGPAGIACFDPPDLVGYEFRKRLFRPGDLLWVRERFNVFRFSSDGEVAYPCKSLPTQAEMRETNDEAYRLSMSLHYAASPINELWHGETRWRPSIHMPQWASRLTLRVTDVRVQRLQDISEADARAEGAYVESVLGHVIGDYATDLSTISLDQSRWFPSAREWYADLWDRINGPGAWARNDWVIATTFTPVAQNVSEVTP